MSTLAEIEEAAAVLPAHEKRELIHFIAARLQSDEPAGDGRLQVVTNADGLPVIRGGAGIITAALVREIEASVR